MSVRLLFDETIKNIAFGVDEDQINEKLIIASLGNAKILDVVKKMKNGINFLLENKAYNYLGVKTKNCYRKRII